MKISVPIIKQVDLLILGGSSTVVEKALALRQQGHSVFLLTPYTYFGEDYCAGLNLHEVPQSWQLGDNPRPAQVKLTLLKKLLQADITFLFQSYPVKLLYGDKGQFAGLLIANRSGFQVIAAKALLDGSSNCLLADLAALPRKPFKPGKRKVERIVLAENYENKPGLEVKDLKRVYRYDDKDYRLFQVSRELNFDSNQQACLSQVECQMRKDSWQPQLVAAADQCRYQLNDGISISYTPSTESPYFFDSRHDSEEIAAILPQIKASAPVQDKKNTGRQLPEDLQVRRQDKYFRFENAAHIELELHDLPILEKCQVLVVGGGTAGAPAAIAAGRAGAKCICLESTSGLGGLCTMGRIGRYWYGNKVGFCHELDRGVTEMGPHPKYPLEHNTKDTEWKRHWLLLEGDKAGVEYRFQHSAVAALCRDKQLCGALVCGPGGAGFILAEALVDASGNADLALAAGAQQARETFEPALQGAGLSPIIPGNDYSNTDYNFISEEDIFDFTRAFVQAQHKFAKEFDLVQMADTRERRRMLGEITLLPQDFYAQRCYDDTICLARSNFDTHGFIVSPMFMLQPPNEEPYFAKVPFRALLPKGLEGLLVTGLAVSAHRDCLPLIRMQPDVHNQGYAAGLAASMAVKQNGKMRRIDIKKLQKQLHECGILEKEILQEKDGLPPNPIVNEYTRLAKIFMQPDKALPELQKKFAGEQDLFTAQLLAFMGDNSARELLARHIDDQQWDQGWDYRGMGQFGACVSPLDCQLIALANLDNAEIIFLRKLEQLQPEQAFSHFRVMSLIFMKYPNRAAIEKLESLLAAPGMANHAQTDYKAAVAAMRETVNDNSVRNAQLKEIYLARALNACQPGHLLARRSLLSYAEGLQACYAIFAREALE